MGLTVTDKKKSPTTFAIGDYYSVIILIMNNLEF